MNGKERLTADLGLIFERMQARDNPGVVSVWWRSLHIVNSLYRSTMKGPGIQESGPTACKLETAWASEGFDPGLLTGISDHHMR